MSAGMWFACIIAVTSGTQGRACALHVEAVEARVHTDGSAENGVWNLSGNGDVGDYVQIAHTGPYKMVVRAFGSSAAGIWPRMGFAVDEAVLGTVLVKSSSTKEYVFRCKLKQGLHRITTAFLNNGRCGAEDRNLYLVDFAINAEAGMPDASLGDGEAWESDWRARTEELDRRTLEVARGAIERVRKTDAVLTVVDANGVPVPDAAVSVKQTGHGFLFGCNIFPLDSFGTAAENDLFKQRFRDLFNYATTAFYWKSYEAERGKPKYEATDAVLAWCAAQGIQVKGHPLLWDDPSSIPDWAGGLPSPELQEQRVREIVGRYKGKVRYWEVVNEPAHMLRISIDQPYRWARKADPGAGLIINDYGVMATGYEGFYDLLKAAKRRGVPFDGIGIQAHAPLTMRFPLHRVKEYLDRYAKLGKELHITEFTPASSGEPITGSHLNGLWDEATQAAYAADFYTVCFAHPAVKAITWWDLCDAESWQKGGGLLRKGLSPKPAYTALRKLIREDWMTCADGKTDREGRFRFRGFYGTYSVAVTYKGRSVERTFRLERDGGTPIFLTVD